MAARRVGQEALLRMWRDGFAAGRAAEQRRITEMVADPSRQPAAESERLLRQLIRVLATAMLEDPRYERR